MIKAGDRVILIDDMGDARIEIVQEVFKTEDSEFYRIEESEILLRDFDILEILPEKKEPIFFTMSYDPKLIEELGNMIKKAMKERIEVVEGSCCELQEYATNEHSYYTADGKEMLSTWKQKGDHVYDVHVFEKVTECNWKQLS